MDLDTDTPGFRVLLAEDDPVSREFFVGALHACAVEVAACADGPAALERARTGQWDLLLLDHHLPGLSGDALLATLDAGADPARPRPTALAITAAPDEDRAALLEAGFAEVLPKPIDIATLRDALRRHGCPGRDMLDDDAALRACGSRDVLARLRRLFAEQELPAIMARVESGREDPQCLRPLLHRLRASCGFCGTAALASAAEALHRTLPHGSRQEISSALDAFQGALQETREALHTLLDTAD